MWAVDVQCNVNNNGDTPRHFGEVSVNFWELANSNCRVATKNVR